MSEGISLGALLKTSGGVRVETCEVHGDYESRNVIGGIWSKCPKCAAEFAAERERIEQEKAEQQRREAWERKLNFACIPERFKDRTLATFKAESDGQRAALRFALAYVEQFDKVMATGRSAIFCGKPGTGKTHLSIGIAQEVIKLGKDALFITVQRMMRRIKGAWAKDSNETESDVISLLTLPDLLIVDEVGVQFGTEFEKNIMFDVLNERYENRRPTILLSNLTPEEVKVYLGERVFDRLREDGGVVVPFNWGSMRGLDGSRLVKGEA